MLSPQSKVDAAQLANAPTSLSLPCTPRPCRLVSTIQRSPTGEVTLFARLSPPLPSYALSQVHLLYSTPPAPVSHFTAPLVDSPPGSPVASSFPRFPGTGAVAADPEDRDGQGWMVEGCPQELGELGRSPIAGRVVVEITRRSGGGDDAEHGTPGTVTVKDSLGWKAEMGKWVLAEELDCVGSPVLASFGAEGTLPF